MKQHTSKQPLLNRSQSRREVLKLMVSTAGLASLGTILAACGGDGGGNGDGGNGGGDGGGGNGNGGGGQEHIVEMNDELLFDPEELTVAVGDTVIWRTVGSIAHTSTCDEEQASNPEEHVARPEGAEPWDSGTVAEGEEFSHTLQVAGEYTYFCIPHEAQGMIGYLTVEEA